MAWFNGLMPFVSVHTLSLTHNIMPINREDRIKLRDLVHILRDVAGRPDLTAEDREELHNKTGKWYRKPAHNYYIRTQFGQDHHFSQSMINAAVYYMDLIRIYYGDYSWLLDMRKEWERAYKDIRPALAQLSDEDNEKQWQRLLCTALLKRLGAGK